MTEYDGVFFDIGGVILDLTSVQDGHVDFLTRLAEQEGIENVETFIEEWRSTLGTYFRERDGTEYRQAKTGYQRAVNMTVGYELPESKWMPAFEAASTTCLEPNPAATETIRMLDRAGLYLGVISDIDTWEAESMLAQFDTADRFDHITTSEEVGRTKPDREIFETALKKAPLDPERCLYVGDRYEHDMRGGSQVGLVTVAYGGSSTAHADSAAVDHVIDDLGELCDLVGI